jgi:translation initiation factor IF-3
VNAAIRVPEVRVINEDGQQLGVMATEAARDIAARMGLDLVEIAAQARPPVCKIMDYGRYKYEIKKKAASARKSQHQTQVKEIKLRPRISDHDLEFKLKSARKFLIDGDKVKCRVTFRGREIVYKEMGRELLDRVATLLKEVASVESSPQLDGRMLISTLAPNRAAIERIRAQQEAERARLIAAGLEPEPEEPEGELDEPDDEEGEGGERDAEDAASGEERGA